MSIPTNAGGDAAARESARQANGEFGTQPLADVSADVELNEPRHPTPEQLVEALGDGPELTADEQKVLAFLTDPDLHDDLSGFHDVESMLEELADNGNDDGWYGVQQVAELVYAQHARVSVDENGRGGMVFDLHRGSDYSVNTYGVGIDLGSDLGHLTSTEDSKYLVVDRYEHLNDASGLRKAIHIASAIEGDYQSVRGKAIKAGLLPEPGAKSATERAEDALRELDADEDNWPTGDQVEAILAAGRGEALLPRKSVWPENDEEREAFDWWKHEAGNGDVPSSFRDWYENPERLAGQDED